MAIGNEPEPPAQAYLSRLLRGRKQRGFTYLFVLFFIALTAAAMAALGQSWQNAAQRERERELEFRGGEIARAIQAYRQATPGVEQNPQSMADLLEDRRTLVVRHHLRQAYPDPFTGQADWELIPDPADPRRFTGVRSRSTRELLRATIGACGQVHLAHDCAFRAVDFAGSTPLKDPMNPSPGAQ